MSAATITAASEEPGLAGRLGRAVRVELLKLWTTRMWWGLLIGAAGVVLLFTFLVVLGYSYSPEQFDLRSGPVLREVYGNGFSWGQIFLIILGVIAMAGEYRHKTITGTFLATPHRGLVVVAKMLALFVAGVGYGLVLTLTTVVTGVSTLAARGYGPGLGAEGVARTLALSVLGLGLFGVLGVGLATLIRNQIAAIVVALALQFVIQPILSGLASLNDTTAMLAQFLPGSASSSLISGYTGGQNLHMLPWWGGGLVLVGYAILFAIIGWALTTRRDVS
jgi:ABC-2 type transport system permease protein